MRFKEYADHIDFTLDEIPNFNLLSEAGLSRIITQIKIDKKDFSTISAFRGNLTRKENEARNKQLRASLRPYKIGTYSLIGHWQECSDPNVEYKACPKDKLIDVIERSYLIVRPDNITQDSFKKIITELCAKYQQDGAILSIDGKIYLIEKTGALTKIGDKVTLNKISQAYSQYIKKKNVPFVFEAEVPGSSSGRRVFSLNEIKYVTGHLPDLKEFKDI